MRGLDYYTATIFEIKTTAGELGAQNTICGGGRYDGLVASLGGPKTPAIGFALGVERTLLALTRAGRELRAPGERLLRLDGRRLASPTRSRSPTAFARPASASRSSTGAANLETSSSAPTSCGRASPSSSAATRSPPAS